MAGILHGAVFSPSFGAFVSKDVHRRVLRLPCAAPSPLQLPQSYLAVSGGTQRFVMEHRLRKDLSGVRVELQASTDLQAWGEPAGVESVQLDDADTSRHRLSLPVEGTAPCFYRLRVVAQ